MQESLVMLTINSSMIKMILNLLSRQQMLLLKVEHIFNLNSYPGENKRQQIHWFWISAAFEISDLYTREVQGMYIKYNNM